MDRARHARSRIKDEGKPICRARKICAAGSSSTAKYRFAMRRMRCPLIRRSSQRVINTEYRCTWAVLCSVIPSILAKFSHSHNGRTTHIRHSSCHFLFLFFIYVRKTFPADYRTSWHASIFRAWKVRALAAKLCASKNSNNMPPPGFVTYSTSTVRRSCVEDPR